MNVYFISGLGADKRAFEKLRLPERFSLHYLEWIKNKKGETLNDYAKRLATAIDSTQPYALVGLSMGGMIAAAASQFLQPQKTILISSVACTEEFPPLLKLARLTQLHRLVPARLFTNPNILAYWFFGAKRGAERAVMRLIMTYSDPAFVKWSVGAILSWDNKVRPKNIIHIHGDKDKILPVKYTKPSVVIKNGSHFMVWTKAREVSKALVEALGTEEQMGNE